jgi:tetraacyldisaccharide 4'-kinase
MVGAFTPAAGASAVKTPPWWYRRRAEGAPWWRFLLWPLSLLWQGINDFKRANARPYRSNKYVISVGNATLGGSGKTPITGEILRLLSREHIPAAGLSRGYGGTIGGPVKVDPHGHTAAEVGDEPLMLAQDADFWVARDRAEGLRALEHTRVRAVVLDDAHQNAKIAKDLHILVVDGNTADGAWPFGDGGVCPYGPMREPLDKALARADLCVVWMPDETTAPDPQLLAVLSPKPVFVARLTAERPPVAEAVQGFAGIAKPWQFEATLKRLGYRIDGFHPFPDHVSPSAAELERMAAGPAPVITTQKDWVRLDAGWRARVRHLPIAARFEDEAGFLRFLTRRMFSQL